MPQGPDHIYFLMNQANESYHVSNGVVMTSSSPKPLQFSPDGWRNIQIINQRNAKYFALDRSFSVPLDYVKDGAQILRYLYYNRGAEEKVFMCIAKQVLYFDATNYGYYYTLRYKGEIDFINFKHDGPKVNVNIMEGGVIKEIKANENTTVEIPLDVDEQIYIRMDGVTLKQSANFLISNGDASDNLGNHSLSATLLAIEAITSIGAITQPRLDKPNNPAILAGDAYFLQTSTIPTTIELEWDFNVLPQLSGGIAPVFGTKILLKATEIGNSSIFTHDLEFKGGGDPNLLYNHTHHFQGSTTITVPANVKVMLWMSASNSAGPFINYVYQNDGSFKIKYNYRHPTTYIKALRPLYVLQQIISKITDGQYTIDSTLLGVDFSNILITCGDAIRSIPGSKIKTTLSQFFASKNTVHGIGLGLVANALKLEVKDYWVDYSDPVDLGEVKKFRVSPAQDYIYNLHKIGYPDQNYEDVNGRQEFNNTHEYLYPNTRVSKTYEQVSAYRADCYGAEFLRINLDGKTTTDNKGDNDVFMIHVETTPSAFLSLDNKPIYDLERSLNVGATGLLEPETVFNLFLSPKHCLLRNGDYVHSLFYKQDNKYIKFQTTEKNASVVTDVTENADVEIADLPAALFTPNLLEFETKVPVNLQDLLDLNPVKAFRFTVDGRFYMGIPVKVSSRPADKASQEFQLLSAPTNDLTQLEKYNG